MKKIWIVFLTVLLVVVGVGVSSIVQAHTVDRLSDILDDFPLNTILAQDSTAKYYNKVITNIKRNDTKLTSVKFNTSAGRSQEIEVIVTESLKIVEVNVRFFTDTENVNILSTYYDNLLPAVIKHYGQPLKERVFRFFGPERGMGKQAYFNEQNRHQYFLGVFQNPSSSAANSSRGILFQVQATGYYSEIW